MYWELSVQVIPFHLELFSYLSRGPFERPSFFGRQISDAQINASSYQMLRTEIPIPHLPIDYSFHLSDRGGRARLRARAAK